MNDADMRFYLSLLWRRAPWLALAAASITAIGIAVAYMLPPVYRASAKILVEAPQIPSELARSTVPADPWQQVQIVQEKLTTRENLLDFARRLDIYGSRAARLSDDDIVDDMRARTTIEQIQPAAPEQGASMFTVSFDARRPDLAARVANEFVSVILDKNVSLRTDRASDTLQFFTGEVARLGRELTGIEAGILKFKNANEGALPDSIDFRRTQQSNQQERLLMLEREESALRTRRINLLRAFEATGRVAAGAGPLSPEQQTLEDLNRTLSSQLVMFSEASPGIVALRARIAALKDGIKARQTDDAGAAAAPTEMDLQVSEIDDRLKAIAEERKAIAAGLGLLERSIAATPANETALSAMERNRQNIQAQYNIAVAKLAEASTGKQIEANAKGSRMSVVEAAAPPEKPIRPHRLRIAALGLVAGLAAALGLFVLMEMLDGTIRRPKELADLLEAQPLATIPYIRTRAEIRNRRIGAAVASIAMASALPALVLLATRVAPLNALFGKVASAFGYGLAM